MEEERERERDPKQATISIFFLFIYLMKRIWPWSLLGILFFLLTACGVGFY